MDSRRLDTGQVLAMGVLNTPVPQTDIPLKREHYDYDVESPHSTSKLTTALDADKLLDCPEYYGCVYAWREAENKYRGVLLQYRRVTEDHHFATATDCAEWFESTVRAVAG